MPKAFLPSLLVLSVIFLISFQEASSGEQKTLSLNILSRKNQTGHSTAQVLVSHEGRKVPDHWKLDMLQSSSEQDGLQSTRLLALYVAPPPLPADYELFSGVGYYKFHTTLANGFEDASSKCAKEGGHLAIVNSEAEHQVLQTMYARYPESDFKQVWAFVGFHDRLKGEYYTIFVDPQGVLLQWKLLVNLFSLPDSLGGHPLVNLMITIRQKTVALFIAMEDLMTLGV